MKYNCDMINDLLPLYADNVCSKSSADAVEEHISECPACARLLEDMRKCETIIDKEISKERGEVINKQAKFFRRKSAVAGCIIGGIFALPMLICLIVNLASGAGLTWFFIVLAAMFIPASLIVVPLMMPENKGLWTIISFTASIILLLGVCSIYSGGSWFFTAAPSVLFGLSIPFMPFVVTAKPVRKVLGNNKGITLVGTYTLLFVLMMCCIGIRSNDPYQFFRIALAFSAPYLIYMWAMFAVIRLPKWNAYLKTASAVFVSAVMLFVSDPITLALLGNSPRLPMLDFSLSTTNSLFGLICWLVLILGTVLAAIFAAVGFTRKPKSNETKTTDIIAK